MSFLVSIVEFVREDTVEDCAKALIAQHLAGTDVTIAVAKAIDWSLRFRWSASVAGLARHAPEVESLELLFLRGSRMGTNHSETDFYSVNDTLCTID